MEIVYIVIWVVVFGGLCAVVAEAKGRDPLGWAVIGGAAGVFGLIALALVPSVAAPATPASGGTSDTGEVGEPRACPVCGAAVTWDEATDCLACGAALPAVLTPVRLPVAAPVMKPAPAGASVAVDLDRLARLHEAGDLSDDEFAAAKALVLTDAR